MKINKNQLIEIVCKALENDEVTFDSSIYDIDEWDSLSQLSILTELDDALDGKVADIDGIANTQSVSEIYDLLKKNSLIK
tara:strand:- start:115 stop:354 length:240 start_codon:yes stop_codon:yes gene_type:complete